MLTVPSSLPCASSSQSGWPKPVTAKTRNTAAKAQVMPMHAAFDGVAPNRVTLLENFAGGLDEPGHLGLTVPGEHHQPVLAAANPEPGRLQAGGGGRVSVHSILTASIAPYRLDKDVTSTAVPAAPPEPPAGRSRRAVSRLATIQPPLRFRSRRALVTFSNQRQPCRWTATRTGPNVTFGRDQLSATVPCHLP
jgi:hypothetical protein